MWLTAFSVHMDIPRNRLVHESRHIDGPDNKQMTLSNDFHKTMFQIMQLDGAVKIAYNLRAAYSNAYLFIVRAV